MTNLFETFIAVAEGTSLVEAALSLHLTQPTITRQLQQLERHYEMPLFDRVGRRLVLNRAGEEVYAAAKRMVSLERKLQEDLNGLADPAVGTVRLGAGLTPSLYLLPRVAASYRLRYPRVQFHVTSLSSQETCTALLNHDIDLGIVTTFDGHEELVAAPLYVDDLLLVVGKDHPLTCQESVSPPDFNYIPIVLMPKSSGLRKIIDQIARDVGIELQVAMETDSLESINRVVQAGMGAAILPRSAVQEEVESGKLVEVDMYGVSPVSRTVRLVRRKEGLLPACALQFALMLETMGAQGLLNPQ